MMLALVKGGEVIHLRPNISLPHSEFVKRRTGQLPARAWVGTVSNLDGEIAAITSKHLLGITFPLHSTLPKLSGTRSSHGDPFAP